MVKLAEFLYFVSLTLLLYKHISSWIERKKSQIRVLIFLLVLSHHHSPLLLCTASDYTVTPAVTFMHNASYLTLCPYMFLSIPHLTQKHHGFCWLKKNPFSSFSSHQNTLIANLYSDIIFLVNLNFVILFLENVYLALQPQREKNGFLIGAARPV